VENSLFPQAPCVIVTTANCTVPLKDEQEGQHPLTGQRAANFRRDLGAT